MTASITTKPIKTILIAERRNLRLGLDVVLASLGETELAASTANMEQAPELIALHQPDLVILAIERPFEDVIKFFSSNTPSPLPKLMFIVETSTQQQAALRAGAYAAVIGGARQDIQYSLNRFNHSMIGF